MTEYPVVGTPTAVKKQFAKNFALLHLVNENEKSVLFQSKSTPTTKTKGDQDEEKQDKHSSFMKNMFKKGNNQGS